jgi:hypothetical protein
MSVATLETSVVNTTPGAGSVRNRSPTFTAPGTNAAVFMASGIVPAGVSSAGTSVAGANNGTVIGSPVDPTAGMAKPVSRLKMKTTAQRFIRMACPSSIISRIPSTGKYPGETGW